MIIGKVRKRASGSSRQRAAAKVYGAAIAALSLLCACGLTPRMEAASVGSATRGFLHRGVALPDQGAGFVRARPGEDTRWAAPLLREALERAASAVARAFPSGAPLVVGDLSARFGGHHGRHGSHRSGRDVDLLFYLLDERGRSVRGSGFFAFDELGASSAADPRMALRGVALFDTARNWALVRSLVLDRAPVQWIFCADGIKARLLAYGARVERDPEALLRAAYVLHQPTYGNPHRDHFHVRVACTAEERSSGCVEAGPVWPWFRDEHEKPARDPSRDDDRELVRALLAD